MPCLFHFMRALLLILFSASCLAQPLPADSPTVELSAGMYLIRAEVAADFETRSRGLMFRKELASNAGMLFVFDEPGSQCMWMKNTLIPLSVAFLDARGTIINIEEMTPQTEDSHCARRSADYALEMNGGWFAARGIKPGMRIGGIPGAK